MEIPEVGIQILFSTSVNNAIIHLFIITPCKQVNLLQNRSSIYLKIQYFKIQSACKDPFLQLTTYLYLPVHSLLRHFLLPDSLPSFRNSSGIYSATLR